MELKKFILLLVAGLLLAACCEQEIVASYSLSDAEKELIPFTSFGRLDYIDQDDMALVGLTQPRESGFSVDSPGPESCDAYEYEAMSNFIGFENKDFVFELALQKYANFTSFEMYKSILDSINSREYFNLTCEGPNMYREELMTDIRIGTFDFQDVLVFSDCAGISELHRIIYSKEKGIEFIEYDNGDYLKLKSLSARSKQ